MTFGVGVTVPCTEDFHVFSSQFLGLVDLHEQITMKESFDPTKAELHRHAQDLRAKAQDLLARADAIDAVFIMYQDPIDNVEAPSDYAIYLHNTFASFLPSTGDHQPAGHCFVLDAETIEAEKEEEELAKIAAKEQSRKRRYSTDNDEASTKTAVNTKQIYSTENDEDLIKTKSNKKRKIDSTGWGGTVIGTALAAKDTWNCHVCSAPNSNDMNACAACKTPRSS